MRAQERDNKIHFCNSFNPNHMTKPQVTMNRKTVR